MGLKLGAHMDKPSCCLVPAARMAAGGEAPPLGTGRRGQGIRTTDTSQPRRGASQALEEGVGGAHRARWGPRGLGTVGCAS